METPYVLYIRNYNIRVTHRSKLFSSSMFFTRIRSTEGSSAGVLYSFCRSMQLALHLAVKILAAIFLYDLKHVGLTYICQLYFPPECQQAALCYATNTIKVKTFLIFDINHQQNTRSDQIETIKTIMQTTRPRITWKVLPMAQVANF